MKKYFPFIVLSIILCVYIIPITSYSGATGVEIGDKIIVDYTIDDENGTQIDAQTNVTLTVSYDQLIEGFVDGVLGMKIGETKNFTVPPEKGYSTGPLANMTLVFDVKLKDVLNWVTNNTTTAVTTSSLSPDTSESSSLTSIGTTTSEIGGFTFLALLSGAVTVSVIVKKRSSK